MPKGRDNEVFILNYQFLLTQSIQKLQEFRSNRCVFGVPRPYPGKGRPAKHGQKMKLSDSTTWGIPVESMEIDDPTWGRVEIQRWSQFHFYDSADYPMELAGGQPLESIYDKAFDGRS